SIRSSFGCAFMNAVGRSHGWSWVVQSTFVAPPGAAYRCVAASATVGARARVAETAKTRAMPRAMWPKLGRIRVMRNRSGQDQMVVPELVPEVAVAARDAVGAPEERRP